MDCFVGLVMLAGVAINPCHISEMTQRYEKEYSIALGKRVTYPVCTIWFNDGNAWSGQNRVSVRGVCQEMVEEINKVYKERLSELQTKSERSE